MTKTVHIQTGTSGNKKPSFSRAGFFMVFLPIPLDGREYGGKYKKDMPVFKRIDNFFK